MKKRNFRHATQTGVKLLFSIMALLLFLTGCNVPTPTPSEDPTTPPNTQETELPTEQPTEKPIEKPTEEVTAAPEVEDPILKRDMEIKQAYIRYLKIDDECLLEQLGIDYYGDFNGVHVAFIKDGMFQDKMWSEVIGGVEIPYSNSRFLWAY